MVTLTGATVGSRGCFRARIRAGQFLPLRNLSRNQAFEDYLLTGANQAATASDPLSPELDPAMFPNFGNIKPGILAEIAKAQPDLQALIAARIEAGEIFTAAIAKSSPVKQIAR